MSTTQDQLARNRSESENNFPSGGRTRRDHPSGRRRRHRKRRQPRGRRFALLGGFLVAGLCLAWIHGSGLFHGAIGTASSSPLAGRFETLFTFSGTNGSRPFGDLLEKDGEWLGATSIGGEHNCGTLFKLDAYGRFSSPIHFTNAQGSEPFGILCDGGESIYGAAKSGGAHGAGSLFRCRKDGRELEVLHSFGQPQSGGAGPHNGPIVHAGRLYGTTFHGGSNLWEGGVYRFDLATREFAWLASLGGQLGRHPTGALLMHQGWLYGTTSDYERDASGEFGSVFRLRPDGSGLEAVHRFGPGGHPYDRLVAGPDGWLYGTTHGAFSKPDQHGTVFRLHPETRQLETVIDFERFGARQGSKPNGSVVFSADGRFLFGTTHGNTARGGDRPGTLFGFDLERRRLHVLHVFDGGLNGDVPMRTPALVGNRLCGLAAYGGRAGETCPNGHGLVYAYHLPDLKSLPGNEISGFSVPDPSKGSESAKQPSPTLEDTLSPSDGEKDRGREPTPFSRVQSGPNSESGGLSLNPVSDGHLATDAPVPVELTCPTASGASLKLFLFPARPRAGNTRPPLAILLHGGGWGSGNAALMFDLCQRLARLGIVAVAPEFRLAGTNGVTVLDMLEDCRAAVNYLRLQADARGWDRDRILLLGESSGGHLAGLLGADGAMDRTRSVSALVLLNPVVEPASLGWTASQVALLGHGSSWTGLSVTNKLQAGLPPTLVLHGEQDTVVPPSQSVELARAMQRFGNRCDLILLEKTGHAFALRGYGTPATLLRTDEEIEKFLRSLKWLD